MDAKKRAEAILEGMESELFALGDELFALPEAGFREAQTAALIARTLRAADIPFEEGLALTGVKATLGTQGYHVALVADMDAIFVSRGGAPQAHHACGHSVQVAVALAVLQALHRGGFAQQLGGRVSLIAAPAEEYIDLDWRHGLIQEGRLRYASGKQNMIADGVFDDVDCVLSCHVMGGGDARFDIGSTLAGFVAKRVVFEGVAAHSGVAAHLGRNSLHAAALCLQAAAFLAEQFPSEAGLQLHPILTQGGVSMNAVPDTAVLETYVRANTRAWLDEAQQKFERCARHCAAALGVGCRIEHTVGCLPLAPSAGLGSVVHRNMLALCGEEDIAKNVVSGASGDIGDVAALLPVVQFGFSGASGRVHSAEFAIADKARAYLDPARVLLGTVLDLWQRPDWQVHSPGYAQAKQAYLSGWLGAR